MGHYHSIRQTLKCSEAALRLQEPHPSSGCVTPVVEHIL